MKVKRTGASLWWVEDEKGGVREASMEEFAKQYADIKRRRVALTEFEGIEVSTVFLGIDHAFRDGPPILYETMVFGSTGLGEAQERYATREQALKGHQKMLKRAKKWLKENP